MVTLGRLARVELRDIWKSEAQDFTPWLAHEANLKILGDTIGIDLELEAQEKDIGPFRADILCKDTTNGNWVLIENQLERTDHIHLGQLLTYAAGLQAVTIVWVSANFREEHRATLDWLNEITDERFRFFGLEVELWRIGESVPAPKFNVVSKPNDWTRTIGGAAKSIADQAITETKQLQLRYWSALREFLIERRSPLKPQKPFPQHWTHFAIGRAYFWLTAAMNMRENRIAVYLCMGGDEAKAHFYLLCRDKDAIEHEFRSALEWRELPDGKESHIVLQKPDTDPGDQSDWPAQHAWMAEVLERFDGIFRQRIKNLDAAEWTAGEIQAAE